jgi:hypothetical protein
MYRFFTVITNTAVGIVAAMVAMGVRPSAGAGRPFAGDRGGFDRLPPASGVTGELTRARGGDRRDAAHGRSRCVYALYWLGSRRRRGCATALVPLWLSYPLVYCGYALMRGEVDGIYPYPFLDVGRRA